MQKLKHFIKKYFWQLAFRNKIYGEGITINKHFNGGKLNVFTIANEDGILLNLFHKLGTTNNYFIDIGSNDCINSNCANLAFHHNWSGTFIDGNPTFLKRGKHIYSKYFKEKVTKFSFVQAIVTTQNINTILSTIGCNEPDLLCIDLDGNDYHIWDEITAISPRVVLVEVQVEKGNTPFIPTYSTEFELYEDNAPKGASPLSMVQLANRKGYQLVAVNKGCYNLFFVREDLLQNIKTLSIEESLKNA